MLENLDRSGKIIKIPLTILQKILILAGLFLRPKDYCPKFQWNQISLFENLAAKENGLDDSWHGCVWFQELANWLWWLLDIRLKLLWREIRKETEVVLWCLETNELATNPTAGFMGLEPLVFWNIPFIWCLECYLLAVWIISPCGSVIVEESLLR